jgi:hypothetical protein
VRRLVVVAGLVLLASSGVQAQASSSSPSLRGGRLVLSGGLVWAGGYDIGDSNAEFRSNVTGAATPPPFTLFRAESSVDPAAGGELRFGYALTTGVAIEVGASYSRPTITTVLTADQEAEDTTIDAERLTELVIDVGATWQLPVAPIGRIRPFVTGGGGYLRQLYSERTLVETGQIYYVGGGARVWLQGGDGVGRSIGLRGDVRATWRRDGVEFDGRTRVGPVVALLLFVEL